MNFTEAVQATKEGKKVRRKSWNNENGIFEDLDEYYKWLVRKCSFKLNRASIISNDWEIVEDDKDWNLAEKMREEYTQWDKNTLKKCRDLILKDMDLLHVPSSVQKLVMKRFGDLE